MTVSGSGSRAVEAGDQIADCAIFVSPSDWQSLVGKRRLIGRLIPSSGAGAGLVYLRWVAPPRDDVTWEGRRGL